MCDINSFLKNLEIVSNNIKASEAVYLPPAEGEESPIKSEEPSPDVKVKQPSNPDLELEAPEVSDQKRVEELEKIIKTRTDFLQSVFKDFSHDMEKKIQSVSTFVGDLSDGRWDAKGNPVEYFEGISSLSEMARDLGRLKQAVEDLSEAREELNEIK